MRGNRDFPLIWVGGFVAALGGQVAALAMPLLVLSLTGSATMAGVVGAVETTALLLSLIPGGAVADAVERHRLALCCQAVATALSVVFLLAVASGRTSILLVLLTGCAGSALSCMYGPALSVLLRVIVPEEELAVAMSRLKARTAVAQLAGPMLGGLLYAHSRVLPFAVEAAALAISALCLLAVQARAAPAPRATGVPRWHGLTLGIRFVLHDRYLRTVLLIFGVGVNAAFGAVVLALVADSGRTDPSGRSTGVLSTCAAGGALVGALATPRLNVGRHPRAAILVTCWTAAAGVGLLALVPPGARGPVIGVLLGVSSVGTVAFLTTLLVRTPLHLQGRVETAAGFLSLVAQPAGPLVGGVLLDRSGPAATFTVLAAVLLACALVATRSSAIAVGAAVPSAAAAAEPDARTAGR